MKRDSRLHGLTSDHHHALVLALRIKQATATGGVTRDLVSEVRRRFDTELLPHFVVEEDELLPALAARGRQDLVDRALSEHVALRQHLGAAEGGEVNALSHFGILLEAHVRFEERELFPACEALLGPEVLARVEQRAPKDRSRPS